MGTTLHHVYFFMENAPDHPKPSDQSSSSGNDLSVSVSGTLASGRRASMMGNMVISPSSTSPEHGESSQPTTALSATAPDFVPSTSSLTPDGRLFEIRHSPGKGLGVFAVTNIPRGTRIIEELPLLQLPKAGLEMAIVHYDLLSPEDKAIYDQLYFFRPRGLDLEHIARLYVQRHIITHYPETAILDGVRIMGIFSANDFSTGDGMLGIFAICSRFNHSCVPNVHHTFNATLHAMTVHAIRDIAAGEEMSINYLGAPGHGLARLDRRKRLGMSYGFTCNCEACYLRFPGSDHQRGHIARVLWGINQYTDGKPPDGYFIPMSPLAALAQAEDAIAHLIQEGLHSTELMKAYRIACYMALQVRNYTKAMEYALNEEEVEHNILGFDVEDLWDAGTAASQNVQRVYEYMASEGIFLGGEFWAGFPDRGYPEDLEEERLDNIRAIEEERIARSQAAMDQRLAQDGFFKDRRVNNYQGQNKKFKGPKKPNKKKPFPKGDAQQQGSSSSHHHGTPQHGGHRHGDPQHAGPQHAGPHDAGPQDAGPQHVAPQQVGPQDAGPQHAAPQQVDPQHVEPQHAGPQHVEPPHVE